MRKILIAVISVIIFLMGVVIWAGITLCLDIARIESDKKLNPEKDLIINVGKNPIKQIYAYDNKDFYVLWLHTDYINMMELNKARYLGKIERMGDLSTPGITYVLSDQKFRVISYLGDRPPWWIIKTGYEVYQIEKSDRNHPPHYICMIFVSPDKKDIYIFQRKNTRSN